MLVAAFAALPCPVLLLPGNHDPYLPGSLYERAAWSPNVHVFRSSEPASFELSEGICAWGIAYTGRELDPAAVRRFRVPDEAAATCCCCTPRSAARRAAMATCTVPSRRRSWTPPAPSLVLLGHHHGGLVQGRAVYRGRPNR